MNLTHIFKQLIMIIITMSFLQMNLYAASPTIEDYYPTTVNINSNSSLVIISNEFTGPVTVTIDGNSVQSTVQSTVIDDETKNMINCTVPLISFVGSVSFTIQNNDGISNVKYLTYSDCSVWDTNIPEIVTQDSIDIVVSNACYSLYQFQLNNIAFSSLTSTEERIYLNNLDEGENTITIKGQDRADNLSTSISYTFTVDTVMPEVKLENLPSTITTEKSETIIVTPLTTDTIYYQYTLNGEIYEYDSNGISTSIVPISEPIYLTPLTHQVYTLCVIGGDSSGNWQSFEIAKCYTWTVIDIAISQQSSSPIELKAGTECQTFTSTYTGDDVLISWTAYNSENDTVGETVFGNSFPFTPPDTGSYAGIYTISMVANSNNQIIYEENIDVKVPFTIETDRYNIIKETIFRVKGVEAGATLIWDILDENGLVSNPEQIGQWERLGPDSLDMTFIPANVETIIAFRVKVSVEDDPDLTAENGLQEKITASYNILPMSKFTITLSDENGSLSTTTNNDITVKDMVLMKTQNLSQSYTQVFFDLPDSGGTYYFAIKDNRMPPVYLDYSFSTTTKDNYVILQLAGNNVIEGLVENSENSVLNNVTIVAYPNESDYLGEYNLYYETQTAVNGTYSLYLPDNLPIDGWTIIAAQDGYASSVKTDQLLNTDILFTGTDALQLKTIIHMIYPVSTTINFRATPSFTSRNQVDIYRIQSDGSNAYYDQVNFDKGLISVATPDVEQYTLVIKADTVENYDPNTGYIAHHAYGMNSVDTVIEREDMSIDNFGGTISLSNDNQVMKVHIPVNGINKASTISVEQIEKQKECNATSGSKYIYAVNAINSQTGGSITNDEINRVRITLPFSLIDIQPGDLEAGNWYIYVADSVEKMALHQTEIISVSYFEQSNYLGDGKTGDISFWTDRLGVFSIGKPADEEPSSVQKTVIPDNDKGGDCFIEISQKYSISQPLSFIIFSFSTLLILLKRLLGLNIERNIRRQ